MLNSRGVVRCTVTRHSQPETGSNERMIEETIKQRLRVLQDSIARGDGSTIGSSLRELDALTSAHEAELHPQLRHFLQRRSYDKALAFLGGAQDIPAGSCGGRIRE